MAKLLLLVFAFFINALSFAQNDKDSCHCKEVIKSFKYFEKSLYKKKEYFHYPQEAVIIYDNGVKTTPPLNKHIQTMINYTPIKIAPTSDLLIYKITEVEINLWAEWLKVNCSDQYIRYRKKHTY